MTWIVAYLAATGSVCCLLFLPRMTGHYPGQILPAFGAQGWIALTAGPSFTSWVVIDTISFIAAGSDPLLKHQWQQNHSEGIRGLESILYSGLAAIQFWPLMMLSFRRWDELSRRFQLVIKTYSIVYFVATVGVFLLIRARWPELLD